MDQGENTRIGWRYCRRPNNGMQQMVLCAAADAER